MDAKQEKRSDMRKYNMMQMDRPAQIGAISKTIDSKYSAEMVATLQAYLPHLEARQPEQLGQIAAVLNTLVAGLPLNAGASLTAYIAYLEARQQINSPARAAVSPESELLYWRGERRDARRRERALRKLTYARQENSVTHRADYSSESVDPWC